MRTRRFFRNQRAATSIEFAFTAPLFLFVVFALLQFGLWIWTQFALQHATEMAARCASVNSSICGTSSEVQNYAASQAAGMNVSPSVFTWTPATSANCGNQVTASYVFPAFASAFGLPNVTLKAQACFPS